MQERNAGQAHSAAPSSGSCGSESGQPSDIVLALATKAELKGASIQLCFHSFSSLQENTKPEEALLLGSYLMPPFSLQRGTVGRSLSKNCFLHTVI